MKTLLKNARLLTMDEHVPDCENGWLTVEKGRITALGPGPEPEGADEIVDCRGGLLLHGKIYVVGIKVFVLCHCFFL